MSEGGKRERDLRKVKIKTSQANQLNDQIYSKDTVVVNVETKGANHTLGGVWRKDDYAL
jgi:hypothetical protein